MTAGGMVEGTQEKVTLFFNCRLLKNHKLVRDELWIKGNKIVDPSVVGRQSDFKVDCKNAIISPGFIDLQVNGAFGVDFLTHDCVEKGVDEVCQKLLATGTTAYCPTLITSPPDYFHRTIPLIKPREGSKKNGAAVLGIHLEGPFISKQKKGAHPIECIVGFGGKGFKAVEEMYGDLTNVKIITLAPEHEGSEEVVEELTKQGIVVSLGHSESDLDTAERAVAAGASKITHLFNAMPAFHHRDPSLPGLLARKIDVDSGNNRVRFGIIADGIHTHYAALRFAYKMSPKSLMLVTDAIGPMGLPRGEYVLGKTPVTVSGTPKTAVVTGTDTLSGSVATMDFCIRHFISVVNCPVAYVLECATLHPAECLKITNKKGTLNFGTDADFVLLNDELHVLKTYIGGELGFDAKTDPGVADD